MVPLFQSSVRHNLPLLRTCRCLLEPSRSEISSIYPLGAKSRPFTLLERNLVDLVFSLSLGVRRTRDCRFEHVLMRFEENFPGMNCSADDFRERFSDGGWSIYRHFCQDVFKKVFHRLAVIFQTGCMRFKFTFFISNLMSRSKLFSAHFLIRLGNRRTLERRTTTFPIDWYVITLPHITNASVFHHVNQNRTPSRVFNKKCSFAGARATSKVFNQHGLFPWQLIVVVPDCFGYC